MSDQSVSLELNRIPKWDGAWPGRECGRAKTGAGEGIQKESDSQAVDRGKAFGRARTSPKKLTLSIVQESGKHTHT